MDEFRAVTQSDLHRNLPKGDESDWVEFALLPVITGKLHVSDPMFFRDLPPSTTFEVECGKYRVMFKTVTVTRAGIADLKLALPGLTIRRF
jgi:hypothetical protein